MEEARTWRDLLARIISDPQQRQYLADELKVNTITLTRWTTGISKPRLDKLDLLVQALPAYRQQLIELIQKEFPNFYTNNMLTDDIPLEIPSAFYEEVLKTYTTHLPFLRASAIRILILEQMLAHLDPRSLGMAITLAQCVPPREERQIRSLRESIGRGTSPWQSHLENRTQFLGTESLPGYAVTSGHSITVQCHEEKQRLFPTHYVEWEESAIACPLLLADCTAGCIYISSAEQNFFVQVHEEIIKKYADLMVLAFAPDEFYDLDSIMLGIMPSQAIQAPLLAHFHTRVLKHMYQAPRHNPLTLLRAEREVTQAFEEELLRMPLD